MAYLRIAVNSAVRGASVIGADDEASLRQQIAEGADLVLFNRRLDWGFHTDEGIELIQSLRAQHPGLKMMLVSNYEDAQAAAKLCAVNVLAQLSAACDGNLDRVARCLKLGVFVHAVPGYTQQPEVANGASDLMVAVFGNAGKHARAAVGVASLPRGVAVEVEAVFEIS